jgi:DNA-directed RNA polymerase subunit M/transcription elongation factor TFIIS
MGLFKPLWMSKEYYWARKGLERIHDDATLYRVVTEAPNDRICREALDKISSPETFHRLVLSIKAKGEYRWLAFERITDKRMLIDIATKSWDYFIVSKACYLIDDQRVLTDIITRISVHGGALAVWRHIEDPAERLAFAQDPRTVITAADLTPAEIAYLSDEEWLLQIGNSCVENPLSKQSVLIAAFERIKHPPLRWCLRLEAREDAANALVSAVEELTYPKDRDDLALVAQKSETERAACAAVQKIPYPEDRDDLVLVAQESKTERAACAAVQKFPYPEEAEFLKDIVLNSYRPKSVRQTAAQMLPKNDSIFDKYCCPKCGAVGAVYWDSTYCQMDDANTEGYRCSKCGGSNIRYQYDCNYEPWAVPLRTFLEQ